MLTKLLPQDALRVWPALAETLAFEGQQSILMASLVARGTVSVVLLHEDEEIRGAFLVTITGRGLGLEKTLFIVQDATAVGLDVEEYKSALEWLRSYAALLNCTAVSSIPVGELSQAAFTELGGVEAPREMILEVRDDTR